jgi:hypothetical protein
MASTSPTTPTRPSTTGAWAPRGSLGVTNGELGIVEAKEELNFDVIGQCIGGIDMFSRAYPRHGFLTPVAVVRGTRPS